MQRSRVLFATLAFLGASLECCARPQAQSEDLTLRVARSTYASTAAQLEAQRKTFAARYAAATSTTARNAIESEAKQAITKAFTDTFFPAWAGTPWDFNGTTQVPGSGSIACGYFVTTLMQHAGFRVERAHLAQQVSERIVKTLAPPSAIWRFRRGDVNLVVAKVKSVDKGLYAVGLDNHAGLLWNDGKNVKFCHASYVGARVATCEPAETSAAFVSNYHVVGRLLTAPMMAAWLQGLPMVNALDD